MGWSTKFRRILRIPESPADPETLIGISTLDLGGLLAKKERTNRFQDVPGIDMYLCIYIPKHPGMS